MFDIGTIAAIALAYIGFLFAVATYGDRLALRRTEPGARPLIYALTIAIYCTSWTFFGSVGVAATSGIEFLAIYIGPILMFALGWPLMRRIARLSKAQNITSIADFIAARYGKSLRLAAVVTVIAVIGIVPYIALQLKAVADSVTVLLGPFNPAGGLPVFGDLALIVALAMAVFAILFGTRHIDATEHQEGLMLAIAAESMVKLIAFLAVGTFVTFWMLGGLSGTVEALRANAEVERLFSQPVDFGRWMSMIVLSSCAILLLPRQFHVAVVENVNPDDTRRAAWLFPLYLVAINLFVIPIAIAGRLLLPEGTVDADMFVLALPLAAEAEALVLLTFIGGLSAATAMVIVASVALSVMVCNDLAVPMLLRGQRGLGDREDVGTLLIAIRRITIFAVLLLAFVFYRMVGNSFALASIGLISFAAIAQFAPSFFGGLVWPRATEKGALAGLLSGFSIWAYTLLLPSFAQSGWVSMKLLIDGPFGLAPLRPQHLFGLNVDPLTHGVVWSLSINIVVFIAVSLATRRTPIEHLQADVFTEERLKLTAPSFRLSRTNVTVGELKVTAQRYLGAGRTERSFIEFASTREIELEDASEADVRLLRFTERLLASAIGAASSRLVMALLLERKALSPRGARRLLDDASEAIQYNRDLLQSAIDHVGQGISVFDENMRLVCWNRRFRDLLGIPPELGRVGVPLGTILRHVAEQGGFGDGHVDAMVADRVDRLVTTMETFHDRLAPSGRILEVRTNPIPGGGIVTTYNDITERENAATELARANETLERRVRERTAELTTLNQELISAKASAEEANLGKTRFLAAAGHDILQPLNAARLYTSSLVERGLVGENGRLLGNIDASLEAVEDILGALLDISRLDAGALKPEFSAVDLADLLAQLKVEFEPLAREKGLALRVVPASVTIRTDRRLLRRVLQNLISNAIKYTEAGSVLVGCRRQGMQVRIEVHDTGPGIPAGQQKLIFQEFQRLNRNVTKEPGLGLGLSIVERMVDVLELPLKLRSTPGTGSVFMLTARRVEGMRAMPVSPRKTKNTGQNLAGLSALVIDNEVDIMDGMTALLKNWGCLVSTASGGAEALETLRSDERSPDIVLADYHLDEGNGLDVIAALRERAGVPLPAILITADRTAALKRRANEADVLVLKKPVKPAALRALMAQSLVQGAVAAE